MQRALPLLAEVKPPQRVPRALVELCKSSGEAVLLAILYGKKSASQVAEAIGMERAQLSRIVSSNAHMPADLARNFAYAVGNWGWQQWIAFDAGLDLVKREESAEEKLYRLEQENADLRARAA